MIAEIPVSVDIPQVSKLQQTIWKYRLQLSSVSHFGLGLVRNGYLDLYDTDHTALRV